MRRSMQSPGCCQVRSRSFITPHPHSQAITSPWASMISKTPSTNALAEEASSRGFIQPARVRIAASDSRSSTAAGSPRRVPLSHTIAYVFPSNLARSLGVSRSSRTRTRRYAADVVFARAAPFAHSGHCSSSSSYAIPWIGHRTISSGVTSLDHLIRPQQQRRRDREAEGFRRLQVYDELELGRLLDGKFRRLCAFENPVDIVRQAPPNNREGVLSVAHQAALPAER